MAQSKCPKCDSPRFEVHEAPRLPGSDLKWVFVQCASCGAVVGVLDYYSHSTLVGLLEKIQKQLGA